MRKRKQAKMFNYAIGHYWEGETGSVGCYTYFSEVHYGTLEQAKEFLSYVKDQDKNNRKEDRHDWRIFMLNEVPV